MLEDGSGMNRTEGASDVTGRLSLITKFKDEMRIVEDKGLEHEGERNGIGFVQERAP